MLLPLLLAVAQTAGPLPPPARPIGLARADANNDGVVTRAEAQAVADARFARMDLNRDGTIGPDERDAFRDAAGRRPMTAAEFRRRADARFARLDTDRDGVLSGDERGDRRGRHGPPHGRHGGPGGPEGPHGKHADGPPPPPPPPGVAITAAAFRARALARFDRLDVNRDGRLDRAELDARRPAPASARPAA